MEKEIALKIKGHPLIFGIERVSFEKIEDGFYVFHSSREEGEQYIKIKDMSEVESISAMTIEEYFKSCKSVPGKWEIK